MHKLQKHDDTNPKANCTIENIFWTLPRKIVSLKSGKKNSITTATALALSLSRSLANDDIGTIGFFLERRPACASSTLFSLFDCPSIVYHHLFTLFHFVDIEKDSFLCTKQQQQQQKQIN